jgi:hypothetical protein
VHPPPGPGLPPRIFRTSPQFLPILTRQRDHARDHGENDRAALFDDLIQRAETERS